MTRKILLLTALSLIFNFASANTEKGNEGLSEVERSTCLSFPAILAADKMKAGVHYDNDSSCVWEDKDGNCEEWHRYVIVKYFYVKATTVDYYTAEGKLVTSKVNKTKLSEDGIGDNLATGIETLKKDIDKIIFESVDPVCADSQYK